MSAPICPSCEIAGELVTGKEVYPYLRHLASKAIWRCPSCAARVGCHPNTTIPLGTLADAQLRAARSSVHREFDLKWKGGTMTRGKAYAWLAEQLGIQVKDCHIGQFGLAQCSRALDALA